MMTNKARTDSAVFPWTEELLAEARAMDAAGVSRPKIAAALSTKTGRLCWTYQVRQALLPEAERQKQDERRKASRAKQAQKTIEDQEFNPTYDPHRDPPLVWDSIGSFILGDPPVGRRALDRVRHA